MDARVATKTLLRYRFRDARASLRRTSGAVLLAVTGAGALVGAVALASFGAFVEHTSTTGFCLSCHEMQTPYNELSKTAHFNNRTGVRVECADCHVPKEYPDKLIAKVSAIDDIYGSLVGSIDTPEKFEAKRLEMAERVWEQMRATGSAACRSCHAFEAMEFSKQGDRPRFKHQEAMSSGQTCVDCHKGVAHALPAEYRDD
jgi:cytochrome c-type protein NapC